MWINPGRGTIGGGASSSSSRFARRLIMVFVLRKQQIIYVKTKTLSDHPGLFFCEVLRSFTHSEAPIVYFPIPLRKTVPWSLKHRVSIQVSFFRGAAIIFAFQSPYILFPIPRRKTVLWSLKHRVSTQVCFLRDVAIIFAFRSLYSLFPNASKEDCTVVAKTSSVHPGLFFARCCDHFRIPKPLQFVTQYLQGRLYRGR